MTLLKEILNIGLVFSMEFGKNWMQPINKRLHNRFPELTYAELEDYNLVCQEANKVAHNYIYSNPKKINGVYNFMNLEEFSHFMLKEFNWISEKNMISLYNQSCYYASK